MLPFPQKIRIVCGQLVQHVFNIVMVFCRRNIVHILCKAAEALGIQGILQAALYQLFLFRKVDTVVMLDKRYEFVKILFTNFNQSNTTLNIKADAFQTENRRQTGCVRCPLAHHLILPAKVCRADESRLFRACAPTAAADIRKPA